MQEVLTGANVWTDLTPRLDYGRNRLAAIAYVTNADLLPLRKGDRLVVDAEQRTIAVGATDPAAIERLLDLGVSVRSFPGLHAKVFVSSRLAAVGSANASRSSAERLREAVVITSDKRTRDALTEFIEELYENADELSPEWAGHMQQYFATAQPPQFALGAPPRIPGTVLPETLSRLQLVWSEYTSPPSSADRKALHSAGRRERRRTGHPARFSYEEFEWDDRGPLPGPGDLICQVWQDEEDYQIGAPQQVVYRVPYGRRRWLLLLTDTHLAPVSYELIRSNVGDGRRMATGRWVQDTAVISTILDSWDFS